MIKNKKTYYLLILDKSGSMESVIQETVQGFNEQVQMIKNLQVKYPEQEIIVSLTTFNHEIFNDLNLKNSNDLKELMPVYNYNRDGIKDNHSDLITYFPNGMTALYDAIGTSVNRLKKVIKKEIKNDKATAVVVIVTDGHENSSKEFSYEDIKKLIGKLEQSDNWTFSYLGATPDAVSIATDLNIKEHNALSFEKSDIKTVFCLGQLDNYIEKKEGGIKSKQILNNK